MALKVPKIPVCVAIACCGVALIFQIVAVAGTGWLVNDSDETGLFRYCMYGICVSNFEVVAWWKVVRAFSILGLLTIAVSLVLGILHAVLEDTSVLSVFAISSSAATAILLIVELAVFGAMTTDSMEYYKYGYGFILSVIACVLGAIASGLFAVGLCI